MCSRRIQGCINKFCEGRFAPSTVLLQRCPLAVRPLSQRCLSHGATTLTVLPLSRCCSLTPLLSHGPEGASSQSCPHSASPRSSAFPSQCCPLTVPASCKPLMVKCSLLLPSQCPPHNTAFSQCCLPDSVAPLIALSPSQCPTPDSDASLTVFNLRTKLSIE
jgi:hypothetical protein